VIECPWCGSDAVGPSYDATEQMYGLGGTFVYDECAGCGSLALRDVPGDLGPYYPADYYSYGVPARLSPARRVALETLLFRPGGRLLAPTAPGRYRAVARAGLRRDARVLDVGGGDGKLVDELRAAGLTGDVRVVDPYARLDRTAGGAPILRTDLSKVTGTFDVVMFHHSLEHHPDPARAVHDAVARLAPGGVLVVRVPTVTSECWSRYGVDWVELDAPRHLHLPSEDGLVGLLESTGLRVTRRWRDGEAFGLWGSELYRRGETYAGTDPHDHFSDAELRGYERETRRMNRADTGGRIALIARSG
jgi:SAM-dependent methyltransferase